MSIKRTNQMIVLFEVDNRITREELHEALCKLVYEQDYKAFGTLETKIDAIDPIVDIQVIGLIEYTE